MDFVDIVSQDVCVLIFIKTFTKNTFQLCPILFPCVCKKWYDVFKTEKFHTQYVICIYEVIFPYHFRNQTVSLLTPLYSQTVDGFFGNTMEANLVILNIKRMFVIKNERSIISFLIICIKQLLTNVTMYSKKDAFSIAMTICKEFHLSSFYCGCTSYIKHGWLMDILYSYKKPLNGECRRFVRKYLPNFHDEYGVSKTVKNKMDPKSLEWRNKKEF